jgi:hypothetical protein
MNDEWWMMNDEWWMMNQDILGSVRTKGMFTLAHVCQNSRFLTGIQTRGLLNVSQTRHIELTT